MYTSAVLASNRKEVIVWERTHEGRNELRYPAPYYFYVKHKDGKYKDIYGNSLKKLSFNDYNTFKQELNKCKQSGQKTYEANIRPEYKVLAANYYGAKLPQTHFTLFDIEVDYDKNLGYKDVKDFTAPINAIALHNYWSGEDYVLVVPPKNRSNVTAKDLNIHQEYPNVKIEIFSTEKALIKRFFDLIEDSDIISGWNSAYFDVPYVYERAKRTIGEAFANRLSFDGAPPPRYREVVDKNKRTQLTLDLFGRESVDYLEIFKKFEVVERRSFALETISEELFPDLKKLDYEGSLYDLYRDNFEHFVRYNIRDCEILKALENELGYMRLAIQFAHSSTGLLKDVTGTLKLAELVLINYCHNVLEANVPDVEYADNESSEKFKGALVLPPKVGMHDWVASVDVASLYPSTIRAVNISPETIVGQFFDTHKAFAAIRSESDELLHFKYEDGEIEERTAKEWASILREREQSISGYGSVFNLKVQGFIPAILEDWFKQRKTYKRLASESKEKMKTLEKNSADYLKAKHDYENYHRLQYVYKIRLNSLYGALGNVFFTFYDVRLAESTTRSGQELLMHMVRTVAEKLDGNYVYPSESTIYSDTDSCYFLTHANDLEEAIAVGRAIESAVNKSFPVFCREAFFCTERFDKFISAELDVIASKSIFIKKKYYVMQLLYAENSYTDKIKLMGVQIKKTTIPKEVAEKLTEFVQQLLKGRNWTEIGKDIVDYKNYIINEAPITLIGLPKGINGLEDKEAEYKAGAKKLLLSGHAAASIFYNLCLDSYGDTESMRIMSGMKIKTYYLTKKFGRFNSIALPTDIKQIPKWFTEHFSGIIDRKRQADVLIDKPLASILTAIDKIVPTEQNMLYEELMEY